MIHLVITLTNRSIAAKAFPQFIQPNPRNFQRKVAIEAIGKIAQLRNLIRQQLTPKYPAELIALAKALGGEVESIDRVASFLEVEMLDEGFALQSLKQLQIKSIENNRYSGQIKAIASDLCSREESQICVKYTKQDQP